MYNKLWAGSFSAKTKQYLTMNKPLPMGNAEKAKHNC